MNSFSTSYRPEIDGLRALAVLPVIFYHAELGFPGGFVGVDIFFVISGYLITSLIINDLDVGKFSLLEFWARRVRRIIPAITFVMVTCLVVGWFIFWPDDYMDLGYSAVAQSVFISNIYFWMQSGYFESQSSVKPLIHTWSLSVEEQFYLGFPLLLIALARWRAVSRARMIAYITAGTFLLSVYGSYKHPSATFYLLPTRAWELLIGALLAMNVLAFVNLSQRTAELLSWLGISMIAYSVFFYDSAVRFPGLAAVPPTLGALFIIWSNTGQQTLPGRLLAWYPLVFIGLISYSLYLWHWPVLVFSQYWSLEELGVPSRLGLLVFSFILAIASWKWVETPFRRKKLPWGRQKILAVGSLSLATVFVSGFVVAKTEGVPNRISPEVAAYASAKNDRMQVREVSLNDAVIGNFVKIGANDENAPFSTLVWGDSHAKAVMPIIDRLCKDYRVRCVGATHSSTAPLLGFKSNTKYGLKEDSIPFNDAVLDYIKQQKIKNVVLVALWRGYGFEEGVENFRNALASTIDAIHQAGARPWVMLEVPSQTFNIPRALARAALAGQDVTVLGDTIDHHYSEIALQRRVFTETGKDIVVLDPAEYFSGDNGQVLVAGEGRSFYIDNNHLSVYGAMKLRAMFQPIF